MPNSHWFKDRNLVKSSKQPMPANASPLDRMKMDHAETRAQERSLASNPSTNPAGKGKFYSSYAPMHAESETNTYAMPDASHAARRRGKAARSWADKAMKR